jgi:hypothetical protein
MARLAPLSQKVHNFGQSSARPKDPRHAYVGQLGNVNIRDDAADENPDMLKTRFPQELQDTGNEREMGAAEKAETQPIRIFIFNGANHGFGRLPKAGINDLHTRITKRPRYHLDATVMAIETDFGEDHANGMGRGLHETPNRMDRHGLRFAPVSSGRET